MLGAQLNTIHNLHYYQDLMAGLRQAIGAGELAEFISRFERDQQALQAEIADD
jgi:queuine tRNA-ribosyltransferase